MTTWTTKWAFVNMAGAWVTEVPCVWLSLPWSSNCNLKSLRSWGFQQLREINWNHLFHVFACLWSYVCFCFGHVDADVCVCVTGPKACLRLLAGTRFAWIRMPTTSGEEEPQTPNFGVHNPGFWSQVVLNGTIGINGLASCWGCRRDTSLSWDGSWIWWFTSGVDLLDGWLYRSGTTCFDNMTMEHPSGNFRSHKTIKHDWAVWLWGRISASLPLSDLGSVWYFHGASRKLHWFADTRACRVWKVLVPSTL